MFNSKDYRSLLESGVGVEFIALVESAFSTIFEAGSRVLKNDLQPLPLDKVVDALDIDISDCTGDDGKVNWNAVSRKLYDDRRFTAIDMKVNAIVRRAMDLAGLKFVDEAGTPTYAYPSFEKNEELKNIEENVKNGLKLALVQRFGGVADPQRVVDMVDSISVEGAGHALARTMFGRVMADAEVTREPRIGIHELADTSDDPIDYYMVGEVPDEDGNIYDVDERVLLSNEDGLKWVYIGDGEYALRLGDVSVAIVNVGEQGEQGKLWCIYRFNPELEETYTDAQIVHDIVNLFIKLNEDGVASSLEPSRLFDYRQNRNSREMQTTGACQYLARNLDLADTVRLLRIVPKSVQYIFSYGANPPYTLGELDIEGLMFLDDCVQAGLLDADDLAEWAEHADEPDWISSNLDPRILMVARKNGTRMFSGRNGTGDLSNTLLRRLLAHSDELIPALTGKSPETPVQRADTASEMSTEGTDVEFNPAESRLSAGLLKNPRMQVELLKRSGTPESFLNMLRGVSEKYGYIPLAKETVDYMLMSGDRNYAERSAYMLVNHYYHELLHLESLTSTWDTRAKKKFFDEINRNLDERVRELGSSGHDNETLNMLVYLARRVPGFELPEEYGEEIARTYRDFAQNRGAVSPAHFVRIMGRLINRHESKEVQQRTFMELCMSERIRSEYEKRTPIGKRLRNIFMSLAAEEPYLFDGEKGTPRGIEKLVPFTADSVDAYFDFSDNELTDFFSTYLNGKDPDVARLYSVRSEQLVNAQVGIQSLFGGLIRTYLTLYYYDPSVATSAFFNPKGGLFSCTSMELVEVPGATGKKGNRRMVQKNEIAVRLAIAAGLINIVHYNDWTDDKAYIALVDACIAGQHLILAPEAETMEMVGTLLRLSGQYDNAEPSEDGTPRKRIIEPEDIDQLITNNPGTLLQYLQYMPRDMAKKLCEQSFTADTVKSMSRTREGLLLFLKIAELGEMGDAQWENFASAFATGNTNNIKNLIKTLPPDEAARMMEKLGKYLNSSRSGKFTAVSGSEVNSQLGATVKYSMANGLRWMKGYVTAGNPAAVSEDGSAGLYSVEEAVAMYGNAEPNGWRLPTADEILHLGDNPDTISEEALGFTGTGMANEEGELISGSENFCFAWCMGKDGPVGYSVDSNNVIELDDSNIEPGFKLAIKLVR